MATKDISFAKTEDRSKGTSNITLFGWFVVFLALYLVSKTETGYHIIYYILVLVLVGVLLVNYQQITDAMITAKGAKH